MGVGKDFDRTKSELQLPIRELSMLSTQMQQLGISPSAVRDGKASTNIAVRSPIAGTIEQINVEIGQYAAPETVMIRIVNTQSILPNCRYISVIYQSYKRTKRLFYRHKQMVDRFITEKCFQ